MNPVNQAGRTVRAEGERSFSGSVQASWNGHPLYTYVIYTAPGQAKGNGLSLSGGVWHEVTISGAAAPAATHSVRGGPVARSGDADWPPSSYDFLADANIRTFAVLSAACIAGPAVRPPVQTLQGEPP